MSYVAYTDYKTIDYLSDKTTPLSHQIEKLLFREPDLEITEINEKLGGDYGTKSSIMQTLIGMYNRGVITKKKGEASDVAKRWGRKESWRYSLSESASMAPSEEYIAYFVRKAEQDRQKRRLKEQQWRDALYKPVYHWKIIYEALGAELAGIIEDAINSSGATEQMREELRAELVAQIYLGEVNVEDFGLAARRLRIDAHSYECGGYKVKSLYEPLIKSYQKQGGRESRERLIDSIEENESIWGLDPLTYLCLDEEIRDYDNGRQHMPKRESSSIYNEKHFKKKHGL